MPIYEYRCPTCERIFERLMPVGASEPPCPSCGAPDTRRLISLIAGLNGSSQPASASVPSSGGCACGGACACSN